jgi:predicted amidophosphoribosyltransferase
MQRAGGAKRWHGRHFALKQEPFAVVSKPPSVALVVDDMMTSGTTMRLALEALRTAGSPAFGFAYVGND